MEEQKVIVKNILSEILKNKITFKDLRNILDLESIKNHIDEIYIWDMYEIMNSNIKSITCDDKKIIENHILNYMKFNEKYKFRDIKTHINIVFHKYIISDNSLINLLKEMKKRNIIYYDYGVWIKN